MTRRLPLALSAALCAGAAQAQVRVTAEPVFGPHCAPWTSPAELVLRVENVRSRPLFGTVTVDLANPPSDRVRTVRAAAVSAPAHGVATVRLVTAGPLDAGPWVARVVDDHGRAVATETLTFPAGVRAVLLDATPGHHLATARALALGGGPMIPGDTGGLGALTGPGSDETPTCGAERDVETGALVLPQTATGYAHVALAVMTTDTALSLPDAERDALLVHVARGGSLALVVSRREDLAAPMMQRVLGRDVTASTATLGSRTGQPADTNLTLNGAPLAPAFAQRASWWAFHGERLRDLGLLERSQMLNEAFGATVTYGRGSVHLLGWNPASTVALDDPWSERALDAMLHAATSRPGPRAVPDTLPVPDGVRAWLTPAPPLAPLVPWIVLALLAHALALGPLVHALASRRPARRTLVAVPLLALALVVGDRAMLVRARDRLAVTRAITVLEVPAGFSVATSRTYRAVTTPTRTRHTIAARDPRHELVADVTSGRGRVWRVQDRDGVTLRGLVSAPWTTLVVREEGADLLAGSVALWIRDSAVLQVKNDLAVTLRDAVLIDPGASVAVWFPLIAPGVTRSLDEGTPLPDVALDALVTVAPSQLPVWGTPEAQRFFVAHDGSVGDVTALARALGDESTAPRWRAVLSTPTVPGQAHPWRDLHEPMLLARVERPVPAQRDGLRVEAEETWICVRGEGKHP